MIIGEVKEGAARFNAAMRDPAVLQVALGRFGCCPAEHAERLVQQVLAHGHVVAPTGHSIRMVAFGDVPDGQPATSLIMPMRHVVQFLQAFLRTHWKVLRHAQVRDPAFGVLALIEKWGVAPQAGARAEKSPARRTDGSVSVHRNS